MPKEEGILGKKEWMKKVEPNKEALFFLKCLTMRGIAQHKPLPNNITFLDDKKFLNKIFAMPDCRGTIAKLDNYRYGNPNCGTESSHTMNGTNLLCRNYYKFNNIAACTNSNSK